MDMRGMPLIPDYVQELYCENSNLTVLPTLPKSLRRLHVQNNGLQSLPKLPKSLLFLYCSNNRLRSLPSLPKHLLELDCSRNHIHRLPKLPTSLYFLRISHNRLSYLPILPASLIVPNRFALEPFPDYDKCTYIVSHSNPWNPLFATHLRTGVRAGVQAYHEDVQRRLQSIAVLRTLDSLSEDVLACIGSFLSGIDRSVVQQTKTLLAMIE